MSSKLDGAVLKPFIFHFSVEGFVLKKLYVGNIPWAATEDDLRNFFAGVGTVKTVNIITDRDSGRSKGFCFVEIELENLDEALKLDGKEMGSPPRALKVNEAHPQQPRGNKPYGGAGGGGSNYGRR